MSGTNENLLNGSLLSSLYFTRSTGARTADKHDVTFCDAITGKQPSFTGHEIIA